MRFCLYLSYVCTGLLISQLAACNGHRESRVKAGRRDVGAEAEDAGSAEDAGEHPSLTSPGQVVPLLYGRTVTVEHIRAGQRRPQRIPLDYPSDVSYRAFFSALDHACEAELAALVARPAATSVLPDCGPSGAYFSQEALCRAKAAREFAQPSSPAGLIEHESKAELDLSGSGEDQFTWKLQTEELQTRASWALFAVHELRRVVSIAAKMFDARVCSGTLSRTVTGGSSIGQVAGSALAEAYELLAPATEEADALLRQRLIERALELRPVDQTKRVTLTRGLTDSLLERMKLYAAIPYAAFEPSGAEAAAEAEAYDRYPVLPGSTTGQTAKAIVMLAALGTEVVNDAGFALGDMLLSEAWFASLRDAQPVPFGALAEQKADEALKRFALSPADLSKGAGWLTQTLRATGAPLARSALARGPWHALRGLRYLDAPGPTGYAYALTEARATLESEPAAYALRGEEHALELAERSATMALERDDAALEPSLLKGLVASAHPRRRARVCAEQAEAGISVTLEIRGTREATRPYALYRGEDAAVCATQREAAGLPCRAIPLVSARDFDEAAQLLRFQIEPSEGSSDARFYIVEEAQDPAVVAVVSLSPLDALEDRRCFEVPLSAQLHHDLQAIHRDELEELPRLPALPKAQAAFTLSDGYTVPTLWGQSLSVELEGEAIALDAGQPFVGARIQLEREMLAHCRSVGWLKGAPDPGVCSQSRYEAVGIASCLARTVSSLADGTLEAPSFKLRPGNLDATLALSLWAFESQKHELVLLANALDTFACTGNAADASTAVAEARENELWLRMEDALSNLSARYESLRTALPAAWHDRFADRDAPTRTVLEARGLHASKLAAARLVMAIPFELYEPADAVLGTDPLEHALDRFPVVAQPARFAEDTRAEELLRRTALHPLLPELAVTAAGLDTARLATLYGDGSLALALRARLATEEPQTYLTAPNTAAGFLSFLGVSQAELSAAAARIVQLGEARGTGVLAARRHTAPVQALSLRATSPGPRSAHLYALSEGRAGFSEDAWPTSFGMRGFYHAVAHAGQVLDARAVHAAAWTPELRARRLGLIQRLGQIAAPTSIDFSLSRVNDAAPEIAVELNVPEALSTKGTLQRYELWWTDAGLRCAMSGDVAGADCDERDFRFDTSMGTVAIRGASGKLRLRIAGLRPPQPTTWQPDFSLASASGRVYLTDRADGTRKLLAGTTLNGFGVPARQSRVPVAADFDQALVELLAYRPPGEGCRHCAPTSICERTRCELGVCLRAPAREGQVCGSDGACVAGVCDKPGCGDGARSDGSVGPAFEACDDGNLLDGDGCSAACRVERRALEPLIEEAYPAGPAPAIGVDGLGGSLIVYTADSLDSDSVSIKSARFDAFGLKQGSTSTLVADVPRGYRAGPSVTGLRDGGFVVVVVDPGRPQDSGVALRLLDADGTLQLVRAVDASGAIQTEPRVAAQDDGFVVVWTERDARSQAARIRLRRFDAQGVPTGPSANVASPVSASAEQVQPMVVSSLDQALVVWAERSTVDGQSLGIRAQRFSPLGYPVDPAATTVSEHGEQPNAAALETADYKLAWTERNSLSGADIVCRPLRRFGPALQDSTPEPLAHTEANEDQPVLAAAAGAAALVVYQRGSTPSTPVIAAASIDPETVASAQAGLGSSRDRDLSAARATQGIWLVWSERAQQSRALFALLLPFDAPRDALH